MLQSGLNAAKHNENMHLFSFYLPNDRDIAHMLLVILAELGHCMNLKYTHSVKGSSLISTFNVWPPVCSCMLPSSREPVGPGLREDEY